jgi:Leucine-rich repeat (LRR) protein
MGLRETLDEVMFAPNALMWLDLSNCHLETIETEFLNFPQLKTLYLHGNFFNSLD